jgi:putative endonuclease
LIGKENKELGSLGESLAAEFLVSKGFQELGRNVVFKVGEIDLLMTDGLAVVVVEVKTHRKTGLIDPIYKIGLAKQRKLWQLASLIAVKYPGRNIRIDAVTLYYSPEPRLTHYENIISL